MVEQDQEDPRQGGVDEVYVQQLTGIQSRLSNYILMLLGDSHAAANVLQETNIVLWRKSKEFEQGTNFSAWAHRVAYWQVQAYVRDRRRDKHVFDESLLAQLAECEQEIESGAEVRVALRHCLGTVSPRNRELLRKHYAVGMRTADMATQLGKTPSAVKMGLKRIRKTLLDCIQRRLAHHTD